MHLLWFLACVDPAQEPRLPSARPVDGQTSVGATQALVLEVDLPWPDGHPAPDLIRVVRADPVGPSESWIDGDVLLDDGLAVFSPAQPWEADTDYLWVVREPPPDTRRPAVAVPSWALGARRFSTSPRVDVLAAGWSEGRLCAVTSRPVGFEDLGDLALTVDDVATAVLGLEVEGALDGGGPLGDDAGLGGFCVDAEQPGEGARARIWIDGRPWSGELIPTGLATLVQQLRVLP